MLGTIRTRKGRESMKSWTDLLLHWTRIQNPPQYGRRRMRQLRHELELAHAENELLMIRNTKLRDDLNRREETIRNLLTNEVAYESKIKDLDDRLTVAINSAWTNQQRISFAFFDFNDPQIDSSTEAIDVSDLRKTLDEPLLGKITQLNPTTGRHDTIELDRDDLLSGPYGAGKSAAPIVLKVGAPRVGSVSPTSIPGVHLVG